MHASVFKKILLFLFLCQFFVQVVFAFGLKSLPYSQLPLKRSEIIDQSTGLIPDLAKMVEAYLFSHCVSVSAGGVSTCGLRSDGTLWCFGWNGYGQTNVVAGYYTQVSAGDDHTCGLKMDGTLSCWGRNSYGQIQVPSLKL